MAKKKITFSVRVPDGFGGFGYISGEGVTAYRKWADKFDTYEEAVESAQKRGDRDFSVCGNY